MNDTSSLLNDKLLWAERLLTILLTVMALNLTYLAWRYLALHAGWVSPGTGLCSWTANIDCDKVLTTPQARAFYVPNALLGFGFYGGCWLWWVLGRRLGEGYRYRIVQTLTFWLAVASLFTFWFFWLLINLDWLCPFCPWNHILTWVALAVAMVVWLRTPRPKTPAPPGPVIALTVVCVLQAFLWMGLWLIASRNGLFLP